MTDEERIARLKEAQCGRDDEESECIAWALAEIERLESDARAFKIAWTEEMNLRQCVQQMLERPAREIQQMREAHADDWRLLSIQAQQFDHLHADAMIAHRWFAKHFGEVMNGRDFAVKCPMATEQHAQEITRLTKERDEARAEIQRRCQDLGNAEAEIVQLEAEVKRLRLLLIDRLTLEKAQKEI